MAAAEEHQAPGSKAGAHGCSKRGGQAKKGAAAAAAATGDMLDVGGVSTDFPAGWGFSFSSATFVTVPNPYVLEE